MNEMDDMKRGLLRIQVSLWSEPIGSVETLPCDRWLASSIMQKAVRKRDEHTALRAALTLFRQDKKSLWRRLGYVLPLEDIGVGSPEIILSALSALANTVWRRQVDEEQIILSLTRLLCRTTKIRLADEVYSICSRAPEYRDLRESMAWLHNEALADIALDPSKDLPERCLGLWFLAGTRRYPENNLAERTGSLAMAAEVMTAMNAPTGLTEACVSALKRTEYPLALWSPLLWTEVERQKDRSETSFNILPAVPEVEGLPAYGADQFTRVGKSCIREFRRAVPALRQFTPEQLGLGVFYIEGAQVDRHITSPVLEHYKHSGELADIHEAGLCPASYLGMREVMTDNFDLLQNIRFKQLKQYVSRWREEQQFEGI